MNYQQGPMWENYYDVYLMNAMLSTQKTGPNDSSITGK